METMVENTSLTTIRQFDGPTSDCGAGARGGARTRRAVRHPPLTSRVIEAETLARLARKGYDWTGTLHDGGAS